ncbi:MAG: hypothetical protein PF501_18920 [Salinisphaera sp.]|jgi:predicted HAD superfamily Cof-like phosphohydrolase|nr:hypothetical protein [Salinisphaera sp.]
MNETTEHYESVRHFMRLAGQATPKSPTEMDSATRELRARLLIEEVMETINDGLGVRVSAPDGHRLHADSFSFDGSDDEANLVELLDGCCDVNVITTGTLIAAGLTDAGPQMLVDENNLAKFGPGGHRRADGKWIKPADHQAPDLAGEIRRQAGRAPF